jgi:sulfite reductase beta subunit
MSAPPAGRGAIELVFPAHKGLEYWLPDVIKRNYGKWKERRFHGYGIIEHISETGERVFTIKVSGTPNARFSADTLLKFCDIADKYGIGAIRITMAANVEFITDSLDKALKIKEEVEKLGFLVGGWRNTLWGINACTAFLTCQIGVADAVSLAKAIGDQLKPYFTGEIPLPAKLRVFVSGCPNACAGGTAMDISIIGVWGAAPIIREDILPVCIPPPKALARIPESKVFMVQVCPVGALRVKRVGEKFTLEIIEARCINCVRCKDNCDAFDYEPEEVGWGIIVGGRLSNTGTGPRVGRMLIPWLPSNPPRYPEVVAVVKKIVEVWRQNARPGERIGDLIDRIGWARFAELLGLPRLPADYMYMPEHARTFMAYRWRGEWVWRRVRDAI